MSLDKLCFSLSLKVKYCENFVLLKVTKTSGTQSVPSRLTQLKKISLAYYACLCLIPNYLHRRFLNQKSLPIRLIKGKYYYMEAIFKDDHQKDHLEVGLETPNGLFYKVIPSMFLWTEAKSSEYLQCQNCIFDDKVCRIYIK